MDLLSQHEAFLRAIFDAPDDDTPRLVYADFLQENGEDDRAEFIRWQCGCGPERTVPMSHLHLRGFKPAVEEVLLPLVSLLDTENLRRETVHFEPHRFGARSVALCGGRITSAEPFDALFSLAAFARVTQLNLRGAEVVEEKGDDSPFTPFHFEPVITTAGVEALARHRGARNLTSLLLTNNNLDNDAARALVKSPFLDNLKRLDLFEGNRFRGVVWQQVIARFGEDVVG